MTSFSAPVQTNLRLDFTSLLESYAFVSYLRSIKKVPKIKPFLIEGSSSLFETMRATTNWENARLEFENQQWKFPPKDIRDSSRNTYETWEYQNNGVSFEVVNEHKAKTKAVFSLKWLEGSTFGLDVYTKLILPSETEGAFSDSTVLDINGSSFERFHDQEYKINVKVPVPLNHRAKLVMILHEKAFKGTFSCTAVLQGRVSVQLYQRGNNKLLFTISDNVDSIWKKMKDEMATAKSGHKGVIGTQSYISRLSAFETLPKDLRGLTWRISGECRFTLGTHGTVKVDAG
ncbi:hypothetical protein BsWGS_08132 [Bradybaena similaris]